MYESIQEVMEKKRIKLSWCKNRNTPYNWAQREDRSLPFIIHNSLQVSSPPPPSKKYDNSTLKQIPYNKLLSKGLYLGIVFTYDTKACFPYDRDRYDRWKLVSIWSLWSLRSLNFFFLSDRSDHKETRLKRRQ